jgi:hypothetical protein
MVYIGVEKPILKFDLNMLICYEDIQSFVILCFLTVHIYSLLKGGP